MRDGLRLCFRVLVHQTRFSLFTAIILVLSSCTSIQNSRSSSDNLQSDRGLFSLTIAHLNDTHSHLEPTKVKVEIDGESRILSLGGFARIASMTGKLRQHKKILFLHAGDAFQGTLYFTKYQGRADWEMLNLLKIDAMTLGNHEFDKGAALVDELVEHARFPVVAANVDAAEEPILAGKLPPYAIIDIGSQRVGVIGLALAETASISRPGRKIHFLDPIETAKKYVAILKGEGINKIIVLSHNGYEFDRKLACSVADIDIIVGGHTHTLLGGSDFVRKGLSPVGPYPTVVLAPDGKQVLVVTAWEWGKVLGVLDVMFDRNGDIVSFEGKPELVEEGVPEDPAVKRKVDELRSGVEALERQVIAFAREDLPRYDSLHRPVLGRVVADSMLWKAQTLDRLVSVAMVNAGGIRADIIRGPVSVGTVMSVLPFDNSLVLVDLRGNELLTAIEDAADASFQRKIKGPLIVSGLRYGLDRKKPAGSMVTFVEVRDPSGAWQPVVPSRVYRVVTNSYVASGGDYGTMFREASGFRRDLIVSDAEAFMEYATARKELEKPSDQMMAISFTVPGCLERHGFPPANPARLDLSSPAVYGFSFLEPRFFFPAS